MKILLFFFSWIMAVQLSAQSNGWIQVQEFILPENAVWHSDIIGNIYIADKERITKIDTNGVKLYSQSSKSLGRISRIESVNALKILLFSEEQQLIAMTDNTLTAIQGVISLSEQGFGYVSIIATSIQPSKLWVFDQINSKITLLDLSNSKQSQEVENLRGLLKTNEIISMEEKNGKLLLSDKEHQLFILDMYGSLIDIHKLGPENQIEILEEYSVLILNNENTEEYNLQTRQKKAIELPFSKFDKLQWRSPYLYVEESNKLIKYKRKTID